MLRKIYSHVVLVLALGIFTGASCGGHSVTGPSGFDPSKKVDVNNRPPSPPDGMALATQTFSLFEGDCTADLSSCKNELSPASDAEKVGSSEDMTYVFNKHSLPDWQKMYTLRLCVTHRAWPGRHLAITLIVGAANGGTQGPPLNEGDQPTPLCSAVAFNMMVTSTGVTDTRTGIVGFSEDNWDILSPNVWKANLGFRVRRI
jgi:hypothetical protein